MMPTYEYLCDSCGDVVTDLRKVDDRGKEMVCPACGGKAEFIISTPKIVLDGISGDFPTASDRWAKLRESKLRAERKQNA